ncbi:hypothetical protein CSUB01_09610 [Colletotrichum sublineola]|uniref:Uncharacterized protein n=1 Tax=Colletotrichum sublineola TaxID=1173701 RepID=A0A066XSM5_COLSU|nr:hypothetical protein CSUB01_09610 [Colletotrichum sublineola]
MGNDSPSLPDEPAPRADSSLSSLFGPDHPADQFYIPELRGDNETFPLMPCSCFSFNEPLAPIDPTALTWDPTTSTPLPSAGLLWNDGEQSTMNSPFEPYFSSQHDLGVDGLLSDPFRFTMPLFLSADSTTSSESQNKVETVPADSGSQGKRRRTRPAQQSKDFCPNCACSTCLSKGIEKKKKTGRKKGGGKPKV